MGVPFFAGHIKYLTRFDSKLADMANLLIRQLGGYLRSPNDDSGLLNRRRTGSTSLSWLLFKRGNNDILIPANYPDWGPPPPYFLPQLQGESSGVTSMAASPE